MRANKSIDKEANVALLRAREAAERGSFGVGAVLVDDHTRSPLDSVSNDVVRKPASPGKSSCQGAVSPCLTYDPTAHGERQLITRYFERVHNGEQLPPPDQVTIVSSLEPCAMCSGAILSSGFKVGVIALDPVAGLGMTGSDRFRDLPKELKSKAADSFGYFEVPGKRPFVGARSVALGEAGEAREVSREVHDACEATFLDSLEQAMAVVSEGDRDGPRSDPSSLDPDDPLRSFLGQRLPHFMELRLSDPHKPDRELFELLKRLHQEDPGGGSSAALVDQFGNLLAASGGGLAGNPIATGFAEVVRTYSGTRFELAGNPALSGPASKYLAHPKFGNVFRYPVPDPKSPVTLFELGVYGSTLEGPLPQGLGPNLRFIGEGVDARLSRQTLLALIEAMPPFYSQTVGLDVEVISL